MQEKISDGFAEWFRVEVNTQAMQKCSQLLKDLSWVPSKKVKMYKGYIANEFQFHTRDRVDTYFEEVQNDETKIEWDFDEEDSDKYSNEETVEDSEASSENDSDEDSDR
ncbi:hypothetical protein M9H77_09110 [Catharanthus roseus]|uniref:Uncharacterized protein n=1 Tax=Catharanthus roseus TaxID=4058 RepID=A0ACC0BZS3_CATRO|nr:hypothetical protein M9H77_09110 [Catharanthus roseus]